MDVDEPAAKEVAASIGGRAVTADLSDPDAVDELPAEVDVLVNNAGLQFVAPLPEFPAERFAHIQKVMVEAPFRLVRRVLPHMYAQGWGRVVNISSVHGLIASPYKAAYVTAKHGLEGLSKVVALEGADPRRHLELHQARPSCGPRWWTSRSPTRRRPTASRRPKWSRR